MTSKNKTILSIISVVIFCIAYTFVLPRQIERSVEKFNNGVLFETKRKS